MAYARHLAALRTRLLTDPELVTILSNDPTRIHLEHIFDVAEPLYPLITISQAGAQDAVWVPRTYDPCRIQFDCFVRKNDQPGLAMRMSERIYALCHNEKNRCSTSEACFHFIARIDEYTPKWESSQNCWRQTSLYLARVTVA